MKASCLVTSQIWFYLIMVAWLQTSIFFSSKSNNIFLISPWNLCCWYSLEAPHWGASNEYPQHVFEEKIIKKRYVVTLYGLYCYFRTDVILEQHRHQISSSSLLYCSAKSVDIVLFLHENIYCGYSLESTH